MNDLLFIAFGAGLRDGLNPCIFMTSAAFIAHGLWLRSNSLRAGWLRIIFVLVYASSFLEFNFGPAQIFILRKEFIFAAKILYFVLGVWAFILGILFFKDWFLKGPIANNCECPVRGPSTSKVMPLEGTKQRSNPFKRPAMLLLTVILGLVLSVLATVWPINNYIMLLGNEAFLKGQWQAVMPLLIGYVFTSMWPLWFVWAFLSIKNLRPSLLKIVCASVFFTASSCVIFIFK